MAFNGRILAAGHFTNALTTLYTVPNGQTAYVKFFHIHNEEVVEDTLMIFIGPSGQSNFSLGRCTLVTNESADVIEKDSALTLREGDAIRGRSQVSTSGVSYIITGGIEY